MHPLQPLTPMRARTQTRRRWPCLIVTLLVGLHSLPLHAQDLLLDEGAPTPAQPVVVERVAVLPDVRPHSTVVLSGEDLWRRGFRTLGEALGFVVGMNVEAGTGGRVYSQRGIPNGMSLVLDGVPQILEGERGVLDVEDLNIADVERVEVVRGPVTAVNGMGPLSGVVRVFTRKPGLTGGGARVGVTHQGEREVFGDATYRQGELGARASVAYRGGPSQVWRLREVPTRYISVGEATFFSTKVNRDVTTQEDQQLAGRLAVSLGGFLLDGWFTRSERNAPLSRFSHALVTETPQLRLRQQQRVRLLWQGFLGPVSIQAATYASHQKRRDRIPLFPRSGPFPAGGETITDAETSTLGALVRADIPLDASHRLVFGAFGDVTRLAARSDAVDPTNGVRTPRLVTRDTFTASLATAAEYQWDVGLGLHVNAGLVGELRSGYGFSIAPRGSLVWQPLHFFGARVAYSEGTRAPDRYDVLALTQAVVSQRVVGTRANPSLRPERVRSLEAGVSFDPSSRFHLSVDVFVSRHEDAVSAQAQRLMLVPVNLDARVITGAELLADCDVVPGWLHAWGGGALATVVDGPALNNDVGTIMFGAELTPWDGLELGARNRLRYRAGMDAAAGPSHLTDVFVSFRPWAEHVTLMGGVRNSFNQLNNSLEEPGLTNAPDVAIPGPERTFYMAVEGRL